MYALVAFFTAVVSVQASAIYAFMVPPRNWQQFAFYRRAYAGMKPSQLRIGRVLSIFLLVWGGICGILSVVLAVMNVLMPTGPMTEQDVFTCVAWFLVLGALSLLVSAGAHRLALHSRRNTTRLLAEEAEVPATPSETAIQ